MTNAWMLGARHGQTQREDDARATTEPVRTDGPAEEKNRAGASGPDWNEFETDSSAQLDGLPSRMLASDTVDSKPIRPWYADLATQDHDQIIDNQIATSGTAAARELKGQQGPGTLQYAMGIEPVIREGNAFGADYFAAHDMPVQEGAGMYMSPPTGITSRWGAAVDQETAEQGSRSAYQSTMYQAFLDG